MGEVEVAVGKLDDFKFQGLPQLFRQGTVTPIKLMSNFIREASIPMRR